MDAANLSLVPASGPAKLGACRVTASVDATPAWNATTVTLTTGVTAATVTVTFDTPATATISTITTRATLTQPDRSLDRGLSFAVQASGGCKVSGSGAAADPATRTATLKLTGTVLAGYWCVLKLAAHGDAIGAVAVSGLGCKWVWLGTGTPAATKPACPA